MPQTTNNTKKKAIEVGMTLYEETRNGIQTRLVTEVAGRSFKVDASRAKFNMSSLKYTNSNYSSWNRQLYRTAKEILDIKQRHELSRSIRKRFDQFGDIGLTLDQLERINNIINE